MVHYLDRHQTLCLLYWASFRPDLDDLTDREKSRRNLFLHLQSCQNLYHRHLWTC